MTPTIYYIAKLQLTKLVKAHNFRNFRIEPVTIDAKSWNKLFKSAETLAWDYSVTPVAGMELLFKDGELHILAEVVADA